MSDEEFAFLQEVLKDAESSARLSQWEEEFCDDFRGRLLMYRGNTRVSDRQWEIIRRIEGKIYL